MKLKLVRKDTMKFENELIERVRAVQYLPAGRKLLFVNNDPLGLCAGHRRGENLVQEMKIAEDKLSGDKDHRRWYCSRERRSSLLILIALGFRLKFGKGTKNGWRQVSGREIIERQYSRSKLLLVNSELLLSKCRALRPKFSEGHYGG